MRMTIFDFRAHLELDEKTLFISINSIILWKMTENFF
jgi:hypothetical protein